jgi:hypothetical protein
MVGHNGFVVIVVPLMSLKREALESMVQSLPCIDADLGFTTAALELAAQQG